MFSIAVVVVVIMVGMIARTLFGLVGVGGDGGGGGVIVEAASLMSIVGFHGSRMQFLPYRRLFFIVVILVALVVIGLVRSSSEV